jgi:hypothetical protein
MSLLRPRGLTLASKLKVFSYKEPFAPPISMVVSGGSMRRSSHHRYLMTRLSLQVVYLWDHVSSTAPPFILWWSNLELLFGPLHRSSPFIGELHALSSNSNGTRSYIAERTQNAVYIVRCLWFSRYSPFPFPLPLPPPLIPFIPIMNKDKHLRGVFPPSLSPPSSIFLPGFWVPFYILIFFLPSFLFKVRSLQTPRRKCFANHSVPLWSNREYIVYETSEKSYVLV